MSSPWHIKACICEWLLCNKPGEHVNCISSWQIATELEYWADINNAIKFWLFIELLFDLVFIRNKQKKNCVSQGLWHCRPWEIQCHCQHTNLLVYKIWHSLIYSQKGQIRYFFILTRNIWECLYAAPSGGCK